jgi:hypothetical protein
MNANVLHRSLKDQRKYQPSDGACAEATALNAADQELPFFTPLPFAKPPEPVQRVIHVEVRKGALMMTVVWPISAAAKNSLVLTHIWHISAGLQSVKVFDKLQCERRVSTLFPWQAMEPTLWVNKWPTQRWSNQKYCR